jgi:hypothetical protein
MEFRRLFHWRQCTSARGLRPNRQIPDSWRLFRPGQFSSGCVRISSRRLDGGVRRGARINKFAIQISSPHSRRRKLRLNDGSAGGYWRRNNWRARRWRRLRYFDRSRRRKNCWRSARPLLRRRCRASRRPLLWRGKRHRVACARRRRSRRLRNFLGHDQGRKFRVRNNFHGKNCLAALDFVAVGEHCVLDARAIQKRAIATLAILHEAAGWPALHGKVHARHKRVVRQDKLRAPRRPPESHSLPRGNSNFLPRRRPFSYLQYYAHCLLVCYSRLHEHAGCRFSSYIVATVAHADAQGMTGYRFNRKAQRAAPPFAGEDDCDAAAIHANSQPTICLNWESCSWV